MFQRGWNHQADGIILLSIILYTVIYNHNHGFACLKIGAQTHFSCKPMLKNPPFLCGAIESLLATPKMNYWWTSCTVDICDNWLLNIIDLKKYIYIYLDVSKTWDSQNAKISTENPIRQCVLWHFGFQPWTSPTRKKMLQKISQVELY